jgi:hypothetical protein
MVRCPLPERDDAHASRQVYAEAEQDRWCFGCARGGRIYDLASLLFGGVWGASLRGEAFSARSEKRLRRHSAEEGEGALRWESP